MADNWTKLIDVSSLQSCKKKTYWNINSCIKSTLTYGDRVVKRLLYLSVFKRRLCQCQKERDHHSFMQC